MIALVIGLAFTALVLALVEWQWRREERRRRMAARRQVIIAVGVFSKSYAEAMTKVVERMRKVAEAMGPLGDVLSRKGLDE